MTPKPAKNRTVNRTVAKTSDARGLPPYVVIKHGRWYVRRNCPTRETSASGQIKYIQVVRRCAPETEDRAKELAGAIADEIRRVQNPLPVEVGELTVNEYITSFLALKHRSVSVRTAEIDNDIFSRFIKTKWIGDAIFAELRTREIERFYGDLWDVHGASPDTIARVNKLLSGAFNFGMYRGDVSFNPTRKAVRPTVPDPEISVFSEQEARKFLETCHKDDENIIFEFALETFARPEEYLALELQHIDLVRGLVTIRQKVTYNKATGWIYKKPKTKTSRRTIEISEHLAGRLRTHLAKREEWIAYLKNELVRKLSKETSIGIVKSPRSTRHRVPAQKVLENLSEHDLLFPSSDGTPLSIKNLNVRAFKAAVKAAGFDPTEYTVYSLRHTGITLSLVAGAHIKAVSEKAGHASIKITLDTYGHVLPSMRREATDKVSGLLYGTKAA